MCLYGDAYIHRKVVIYGRYLKGRHFWTSSGHLWKSFGHLWKLSGHLWKIILMIMSAMSKQIHAFSVKDAAVC